MPVAKGNILVSGSLWRLYYNSYARMIYYKSLRGQSVLWRTVIGLSLIRGSTTLDVSKLVFSKKRGKREKERKPLEKIQ